MSPILQPWHILLACLCGLVNQRQQQIIEFQNAQIEALLNQLGRKRLLLDDDQRRLLAVKAYGIEPEPDRQRTPAWSTILKAHGNSIFATDFTTVEVGTRSGLVTFYILAVMHVQTRRVHIAGITPSPNCTWIRQVCRNLTDCEDGILRNASHLIVDRESSFIPLRGFVEQNTQTEVILLPTKTPNMNAYMERWFRSLKSECLDRMIFFGRKSLENAVREYVEHYHA